MKKWLLAANVALAAGLAGAALCAVWPLDRAAAPRAATTRPTTSAPAAAPRLEPLSAYAVIYERNLRRPLSDAPATPTAAAPKTLPPLRLTGTAVEPGNTFAIFRTSQNEVKLVGVGDSVDGAEVLSIDPASATLRYKGETFTLKVQNEGGKP